MDGDGALPRNVAKKPSTSTGRAKTSKRLLSSNSTDNTNPKKRKSLNVSSSSLNNSLNIFDVKPSDDKSSDNLESQNDLNITIDVSSVSDISQSSICDSEEIPNNLADKKDQNLNKNKRIVKNTKYVDFITNNEMEKIIGVDDNKKMTKRSKSIKGKAQIKKSVVQTQDLNSKPIITTEKSECFKIESHIETNELDAKTINNSSRKKRKKLPDQDKTEISSDSAAASSAIVEQLNPVNVVNKNKRKSIINNKIPLIINDNNSLTEIQTNPELNESASLINSSADVTKPVNRRSLNNSSTKNYRSRSFSSNNTKVAKLNDNNNVPVNISNLFLNKNFQPIVAINYDVNIEKLMSERCLSNSLNVSKLQEIETNSSNTEDNYVCSDTVRPFDPNVYDSTLIEMKSEEGVYALEPDEIVTIDLDDIKREDMSPCSSNSDLSELFSQIRDCHIHLERLCIETKVPNRVNVVDTFDKVIPTCRCNGKTIMRRKSQVDVLDEVQDNLMNRTNSEETNVQDSAQHKIKDSALHNLKGSEQHRIIDIIERVQNELIAKSNIIESAQHKTESAQHKTESAQPKTTESAQHETTESAQHKTTESAQHKTTESAQHKTTESAQHKTTESAQHKTESAKHKTKKGAHDNKLSGEELQHDKTTENVLHKKKENTHHKKIKGVQHKTTKSTQHKTSESFDILRNTQDKVIEPCNTLTSLTETLPTSVNISEKIESKDAEIKTQVASSINEPTEIKKKRTRRSFPILRSHVDETIEEVIKSFLVSHEKEDPSHISSENVHPDKEQHKTNEVHSTIKLETETKEDFIKTSVKLKDNASTKKAKGAASKSEIVLPVKLKDNIPIKKERPETVKKSTIASLDKNARKERQSVKKLIKTNSPKSEQNIKNLENKVELKSPAKCLPEQKVKTPSPRKIEALPSSQNVIKSPQRKQISTLPRKLETSLSSENIKELSQKLETKPETKTTDVQMPNVKNITKKLDEFNITTAGECSSNKGDFDLRQILSEKRNKEKSDLKFKNLVIQTSSNSNRIILKNPIFTLKSNVNEATCSTKSTSIQNQSTSDNIQKLFNAKIINEPHNSAECKTIKSPEIKINIMGTTLIRSNSSESHQLSEIVSQKLNQIYNDQQQQKERNIDIDKSTFKGSTENLLDPNTIEPLQVIIDNDISQNANADAEIKKKEQQTQLVNITPPLNTQQSNSDSFVFAKPKHTFKFIEKCEVKRPPSRKPAKIRLNRPQFGPIASSPSTSTLQSSTVFKALVEKKTDTKLHKNEPLSKYNSHNDDDVISILADTTGLESVCDAASVRHDDDSDYEDDFNITESFMDKERFEQVKDWLSQTSEEPVVPQTVAEPAKPTTEPVVPSSPMKKSTEIPVARVNPGIQKSNVEEKLAAVIPAPAQNESSSPGEHVNVKLVAEEKRTSERQVELEMFRNLCHGKFRNNFCPRKKCFYAHNLPSNWQGALKSMSADALMRVYKYVKEYNMAYIYKSMLSLVAEQLGTYKDFNNLTSLVKDVLEMQINTDREPLVKDIIQALINNGFSFYSTVEIIFRSADVEQGLKNMLCDILLNLTVERRQLEDDWPLIQMLSAHKKYDVDKGIIQFIIIEALAKSYLQKDLVLKVYNDLIKRIPDFNMRTISATLCQKFIGLLRKYNLQTDADELFSRCISLGILEKPVGVKVEEPRIAPAPNQNVQQDEIKEVKTFDFPPPLITNQHQPQPDYSKRPPSIPNVHTQYQPNQEHPNRAPVNQQIQENNYMNVRQPSHQHHHHHHHQQQQQQQEQKQEHYPLHSNLPQNLQNQKQYQPEQQEHKNQYHNQQQENQNQFHQTQQRSTYKRNPKNHPLLPGVRADKAIIDQENYYQYFRSTQPTNSYQPKHEIKSYTSAPSTSSSSYVPTQQEPPQSTNQNQKQNVIDDFDRFLCYSTENLDLLANTAVKNQKESTAVSPGVKTYNTLQYAASEQGQMQVQSPVRVELQPYDDHSYAALAPNPATYLEASSSSSSFSSPPPNYSGFFNFPEIKQLVVEEKFPAIMELIRKNKEGNTTDVFLSYLLDALIATSHNYPTFFSNLSDMSAISNDIRLNYMLKTIGVNLVLHLCENNQYDPAYRINHVLTTKYKQSDLYDVYNCKIYLKNKYSYSRRILMIAHMYIIKNDIPLSWNMLRDNAFPCGSYWQANHDEADLKYRDFVLSKLFESFKKIKNFHIALDALLYLMKYKNTDINIREHANSIIVNAINNKCNFDKIEEFMDVSPDWYKYLDKDTFRAILVTAYLERKECVSNLYEIALNLRISPQLMGNERIITIDGHYHYAELQLYLDKFFQSMVNYMPITHNIVIDFSLNDESKNDEIPLLVHQYNSSKTVLATRVKNILENMMKPPIHVLHRNNCLYLNADSVNTHLLYRRQLSSL